MVTKRQHRHGSLLLVSTLTLCAAGCALPEYDKVDQSPLPNEPIGVAAGAQFSGVVFRGGQVKMWGANESGQLGLGSTTTIGDGPGEMSNALPVTNLGTSPPFRAEALAAGNAHVCALSQELYLKCWGSNSNGQLGVERSGSLGLAPGQMADLLPLANLRGPSRPVAVAAGGFHTCAVLKDGVVKCWGKNDVGQLGLGDTQDRGAAIGSMGENLGAVDLGSGARSVAAGQAHTCAILENGNVKCWGKNDFGQLGIGDTGTRGDAPGELSQDIDLGPGARSIAAGGDHTCAVLDDDTVKCWGKNDSGQIGMEDQTNHLGDAPGEVGPSMVPVPLPGAKAVACGALHSCALLSNDRVLCWGRGDSGQAGKLGVPDLGPGRSATAIAAGGTHTCAVLDDGSVKCWGSNEAGQLGVGSTTPSDTPRVAEVGNP